MPLNDDEKAAIVASEYGFAAQFAQLRAEGFTIPHVWEPPSVLPPVVIYEGGEGWRYGERVASYHYRTDKRAGYWEYTKSPKAARVREVLEGAVFSHLSLWIPSPFYAGEWLTDYYSVLGYHRESSTLAVSNFEVMRSRLITLLIDHGIEPARVGVFSFYDTDRPTEPYILGVGKFGNDAVGWSESLYLHRSTPAAILETVNEWKAQLADYPILDEDDYTERWDAMLWEYWQKGTIYSDRLVYCRAAGIDGRAARNMQALSKYPALYNHLDAVAAGNGW